MTTISADTLLVDTAEAARLLYVSESTLWGLMRAGKIKYLYPSGRARRIRRTEIERFLDTIEGAIIG